MRSVHVGKRVVASEDSSLADPLLHTVTQGLYTFSQGFIPGPIMHMKYCPVVGFPIWILPNIFQKTLLLEFTKSLGFPGPPSIIVKDFPGFPGPVYYLW